MTKTVNQKDIEKHSQNGSQGLETGRKESNQVTAVFRTVINFVCPSVQIVLSPCIFILYCKLNRVFVFYVVIEVLKGFLKRDSSPKI